MRTTSIKSNIIKKEVNTVKNTVWGDIYYQSYKEVRFTDGVNDYKYVYAVDKLFIKLSEDVWILIS